MKQQWLSLAQRNAPRYTSYPTAVQFDAAIGEKQARDWAHGVDPDAPLSVYVHVPFCEQLCWYCGCLTTIPNGYDRIAEYFAVLKQEAVLWRDALGHHGGAKHVHFGGGTPNALNAEHMLEALELVHSCFHVRDDAEIAAELDPRTLDMEMIRALAAGGLTRASLGVQDFNEKVQRAVNRIQPYDMVKQAVERLRRWDINAISFDLLFGLPHQTLDTVKESARMAASLSPDRISAFGYAHVPWFAKHQKMIDESALPDPVQRFEQFHTIVETLEAEGYVAIGLDHFARADDELARAAKEGRLQRNFQGYTDDPCDTLVALGPSGISQFAQGYLQNVKSTREWRDKIIAGQLATERGVMASREDLLRRDVITRLMCDMQVDFGLVCQNHGYAVDHLDEAIPALMTCQADGVCSLNDRLVCIPRDARMFMRLVAQSFDAYAQPADAPARHAKAV